MRRLTRLAPIGACALSAALAAPAPPLAATADTNDAIAYFEYGNLRETPWKKSQEAYYLALALSNEGRKEDAITQFREFISRAPHRYVGMIESANRNIAALQGATAAAGGQK